MISPKKLSGLLGEEFTHPRKYFLASEQGLEFTYLMSDSFYVISYDDKTYKVYTIKHDNIKQVGEITNNNGSWRLDSVQ